MLRVHVDNPDGPPQDHTFTKPEVMIGRRPDNDLVLPGKDVSGSHACLQVEDGRVMLYDLRSTNGTFINGQQIPAPAELGPDDVVTISVFSLRVALTNPQANPPEPPVETLDDADLEPAPSDDLDGPPLARSPVSDQTPADFDADAPPVVVRPRVAAAASSPLRRIVPIDPTPPPVAPLSPVAPLPDFQTPSSLAQAWQGPTVRRIFLIGLTRVEVERDGVRLPMSLSFASVDDLSAQLSTICGHPVRFTTPEQVLADGTVIQATETSEHGPYVVLTRPRVRCLVGLGDDLQRLGLTRDDARGETEDHVSYLFEVMRYLIAGDDAAVCNLEQQRRFFRVHVQPWVAQLCDVVQAHPRADTRRAVAEMTRAFVAVETQGFDLLES